MELRGQLTEGPTDNGPTDGSMERCVYASNNGRFVMKCSETGQ